MQKTVEGWVGITPLGSLKDNNLSRQMLSLSRPCFPLIRWLNHALLCCIVFIHFYSASISMSYSEALQTTALPKVLTCLRSLSGG